MNRFFQLYSDSSDSDINDDNDGDEPGQVKTPELQLSRFTKAELTVGKGIETVICCDNEKSFLLSKCKETSLDNDEFIAKNADTESVMNESDKKEEVDEKTSNNVNRDVMRERFKLLQERKKQITDRNTSRRIRQLQKDTMTNVLKVCNTQEEIEEMIPNNIPLSVVDNTGESSSKRAITDPQNPESPEQSTSLSSTVAPSSSWGDIKSHLSEFDHLKGVDLGKYASKSRLEEKIDEAIQLGQHDIAEKLSDHLSNRDFSKKIANAFDAKEFLAQKKKEEESRKKRKRKIPWTFENKERWETKSNM